MQMNDIRHPRPPFGGADEWTVRVEFSKEEISGSMLQCQNYRTISLISHRSKVMLKIMLNRLTPQAKNRQASEQGGAPQGRCSTYESSVRNISSTSKTSTMSS